MELAVHNNGTWSLRKLHALEKLLIERIIESADASACPEAMGRLYPYLLGRPPLDDEEEKQNEEWREYVQPDLRDQFNSNLNVVSEDLKMMRQTRRKDGDQYALTVPKKHADQWCGALNQARLVLHERFRLPDPDNPSSEDESDFDDTEGKWMAMLQSEIYGHIMEFLVTRVLWMK